MATPLDWLLGFLLIIFRYLFAFDLLLTQLHSIPLEIPLLVGLSIDLHDGVFRQSLRAHQLVARRVVDNIYETDLPGAILGAPSKITMVNAQRSVLHVAASATNRAHALLAELA